ncbi:MAG TPA: NF038122 family metalloprotease [Blastocatellia bacterium]|nr:NF038122 family metalloprotease [Blastocatellia bacterium]
MKRQQSIAIVLFVLMLMALATPITKSSASSQSEDRPNYFGLVAMPEVGAEVQDFEDGTLKCRQASPEEALEISRRDPNLQLQEITNADRDQLNAQTGGLTFTLRATSQLEQYPQAKAAFLRAAGVWESILQNPIHVVVDVDFGPTGFGRPFPPSRLGETGFQNVAGDSLYPTVRDKLIAGASSVEERSLYNLLPAPGVPTDIGVAAGVFGPATMFRALGILDPVADPERERATLGAPPSISFNSAFKFDFDPSDGIDRDKIDFTAVAEHEIGHLLGFFSAVGIREQVPDSPLGVSVWDLFRFRPGVTLGTFTSSPRVLSSGGVHVFFAGHSEVQLSTGRGDQSGGDHEQSHHWKANELSGRYLGVMDPTLDFGEVAPITDNDLDALDAIGYRVARDDGDGVPVIRDLAASLDGDMLSLTGTAVDSGGDIAQAQVKLLNGGGLTVAQTSQFAVDFGTSSQVSFRLTVSNLSNFPTAVQARLELTDRQGQTSKPVIAMFNHAVPGGPLLSNVSRNGKKLKIKGEHLDGGVAVEINGVIVAEGTNESDNKMIVKGSDTSLNLRSGPNRVRVRNGALWSNIYILDL